jgi:hypothetical protein
VTQNRPAPQARQPGAGAPHGQHVPSPSQARQLRRAAPGRDGLRAQRLLTAREIQRYASERHNDTAAVTDAGTQSRTQAAAITTSVASTRRMDDG